MSRKNSILWALTSSLAQSPSYLAGTMHVRDGRAFYGIDAIKNCIRQTSYVATEIDLSSQRADQRVLFSMPAKQGLSTLFTARQWQKIDRVCKLHMNVPLSFFETSYPMVVMNLMLASFLQSEMPVSLDQYITDLAQKHNIAIGGIETFEEQMSVFKMISIRLQSKGLLDFCRRYKTYKTQLKKMLKHYMTGDIYTLQKMAKKGIGKNRKVLLYNRNYIMADRIAALTHNQPSFIAIGAGHLAGAKGVLRLLKQKGFQLEAVSIN